MRSAALAILLMMTVPAPSEAQRARLDLDGAWDFQLDPREVGEAEAWASSSARFSRAIQVPGAWQAQGVGEPKRALRHDYAGTAWYRRTVAVPAAWRGKLITLRIGGAHRHTTLFVNGRKIGEHRGFSAPFRFDVTDAIRPGSDNVFALRISNPGEIPLDGPREQKPVQPTGMLNYLGNWGGVYGHVELQATEATWIEQVYVRPDVEQRLARFIVSVRTRETSTRVGEVRVSIGPGGEGNARVQVAASSRRTSRSRCRFRMRACGPPRIPTFIPRRSPGTKAAGRGTASKSDSACGRSDARQRAAPQRHAALSSWLRRRQHRSAHGIPAGLARGLSESVAQAEAFGFNTVRFHSMTPPESSSRQPMKSASS